MPASCSPQYLSKFSPHPLLTCFARPLPTSVGVLTGAPDICEERSANVTNHGREDPKEGSHQFFFPLEDPDRIPSRIEGFHIHNAPGCREKLFYDSRTSQKCTASHHAEYHFSLFSLPHSRHDLTKSTTYGSPLDSRLETWRFGSRLDSRLETWIF